MATRRALHIREICEYRQRFGQEVQALRKSRKMTQATVARRLEWSRTTVVAIERGLQAVTIDQAVCLACLFQVSVRAFFPNTILAPDNWLLLHGPARAL